MAGKNSEVQFKFHTGVNVSTSDPYYDLFDGGYIKEFLRQAEGEEVIELC